jgi:hypothetical protein
LSILTKICIVILLVLILIGSAVFIHAAVLAPNWKDAYQRQEAYAKLQVMEMQLAQLAAKRDNAMLKRVRMRLEDDLQDARADLDAAKGELAQKNVEAASMRSELSSLGAKLAGLEKTAAGYLQRNKTLASQLDQTRVDLNDTTKKLQDMTKQWQQAVAASERQDKLVKVLREEIAERDRQIEELTVQVEKAREAGAGAGEVEGPGPTQVGTPITGTLLAIKDNVASINVGSAHGVKPDMKMIIYRGGKFVGYLQVEEVAVNEAAGLVTDTQLQPVKGDKVTTSLK